MPDLEPRPTYLLGIGMFLKLRNHTVNVSWYGNMYKRIMTFQNLNLNRISSVSVCKVLHWIKWVCLSFYSINFLWWKAVCECIKMVFVKDSTPTNIIKEDYFVVLKRAVNIWYDYIFFITIHFDLRTLWSYWKCLDHLETVQPWCQILHSSAVQGEQGASRY